MSERSVPRLAKWPFFLGDLLMLACAGGTVGLTARPAGVWPLVVCAACVGIGAWLAVTPFLWEYRAALKLAEADGLATTVGQIREITAVARQIEHATGHWQSALDASAKTVGAAGEIADRMTAEAKSFAEFMKKANDSEKAHLRLEVDKLRRAEGEWLQVLTHIFDHVYALYSASTRAGQPKLAEQLGHFQDACRDAARRIGLVPFAVTSEAPFDAKLHQTLEANGEPPPQAHVAETIATGYTFQGQLLRKAVVTLRSAQAPPPAPPPVDAVEAPAPDPDSTRSEQ
ncbi:MAG: nucleotide exchange factor GrpE [Verrucomicrobia bacterium]|nr:nucleotide exchange factor GrpE [Verrucomicrobiota bacterium]